MVRKQFKREHDVDQFLWCKLKFDDSGLENYERGGDFYFGMVAPGVGHFPSRPRALPLGGVGGASFLLLGTCILIT